MTCENPTMFQVCGSPQRYVQVLWWIWSSSLTEVIWKLVKAKYIKQLTLGDSMQERNAALKKSLSHDSKFKAILKLLKPENKSKVSCIDLHQVDAKHKLCKLHSQCPRWSQDAQECQNVKGVSDPKHSCCCATSSSHRKRIFWGSGLGTLVSSVDTHETGWFFQVS